jgi:hypothetical protein
MPFPVAHPAAVLPLRRYCPRYLSFPALVVGSLSPDFGYVFGHLQVDRFSHRFWAGSFGFCLPAGLLIVWVFYLVRAPLLAILPGRYTWIRRIPDAKTCRTGLKAIVSQESYAAVGPIRESVLLR